MNYFTAKSSQSAVEYLIIIGFVSIVITTTLLIAYFYVNSSQDRIKTNQLEVFANKIISSSERIFYAGQPSQTFIQVYLPQGIESIDFSAYELVVRMSTSSGEIIRAFKSKVYLEGSIAPSEGIKSLILKAESNKVVITPKNV